jgi:hypothetical protein
MARRDALRQLSSLQDEISPFHIEASVAKLRLPAPGASALSRRLRAF